MIVHDVVQLCVPGVSSVSSYKPGRFWKESHDDIEYARKKAALFNHHCSIPAYVQYVVESHEELSPERAMP